jgi:hypothetical protein
MAVLSLPLVFTNSFWTQDYRTGLEVLYSKLEQVYMLPRSRLLTSYPLVPGSCRERRDCGIHPGMHVPHPICDPILTYAQARAAAENQLAIALLNPSAVSSQSMFSHSPPNLIRTTVCESWFQQR